MLPLLTCGLLAACGGVSPAPGGGGTGGGVTYSVSGDVRLPLSGTGVSTLGLNPQTAATVDWTLPHVQGEVLLVRSGAAGPLPGRLGTLSVEPVGAAGSEISLERVRTPAGETDVAFAARLTRELGGQGLTPQGLGVQGGVLVQPNYIYSALSVPNDPGYPSSDPSKGVQIGNQRYDQDYLTRINAEAGWDAIEAAGKPLTAAITAVLDTGVDFSHPDLQGRLLPGFDVANNDNDPSEATGGDVGHGTSSLGLIGATGNNAVGITGLTWTGRNLLPVRVFDDAGGATTADLAQGLDYAVAQKAKVVNMSLGLKGANSDAALASRIEAASNAGLVLVAAAGNTPNDGLYYPASDPRVLAVGAVGRADSLACYSARPANGQKPLDLLAPGGNAGTGTSNCLTGSDYDILTLAASSEANSSRVQNGYALRAGTSEAAPQVSGAAALIRAFRPDLRASQVNYALTSTAKPVSGGKLLNVGEAVKLAGSLPKNTARAYTLTVSAGSVSKTVTGTLAADATSVPYSLSGLLAGQTTVTARLTATDKTATGSVNLDVQSDLSVQTIQTK